MYMRFCPSCGKENACNGKFCCFCGRNLEEQYGGNNGVHIENADERFQIWNGCLQRYVGKDKTVVLPANVETIDVHAFLNCSTMERLIIPDTVRSFRYAEPFDGSEPLRSVFIGCTNLKYVEFGGGMKVLDCMVIDARNIETIVVREGVEELAKRCFLGAGKMTSISLPSTLKKIGDHSFGNCESLKDIIIPDGVLEIGSWAFVNSFGLENVYMGNSVRKIGQSAFEGCRQMREFRFPNTDFLLEDYGRRLFMDCISLRKIYYPARMKDSVLLAFSYSDLHRDFSGKGEGGVALIEY
ncbi:MAG: leucine-rich repeat domain-containing protein [Clostridia bacterium]|nr:leucine-rich repeat domain-containing protein [Clostridia bacterium]